MRIARTLAISAGLAVVGSAQVVLAQGGGPGVPDSGTVERNQGIIRPPEHQTQDPNQAQVPGTRDNPNIFDRDRGLGRPEDRWNRGKVVPDHGPSTPR